MLYTWKYSLTNQSKVTSSRIYTCYFRLYFSSILLTQGGLGNIILSDKIRDTQKLTHLTHIVGINLSKLKQ
jgi:hypothetical protein